MALLLVILTLATAAVLAFALLSVSSLGAELSGNLRDATAAEFAAEGGVHTAVEYLQLPATAPASWTDTTGDVIAASAVPLADGTGASFDVTAVATSGRNNYTIQTTGRSAAAATITHADTVTISVNRVPIPGAGLFGGSITIPKKYAFSAGSSSGALAIQANGTVKQTSGSTVTGTVSTAPLTATAWVVPTAATVNFYGDGMNNGTYLCADGVTSGTPQQITASSISTLNFPLAAASNPGAVYYHNGALTVSGALVLNGTLIVRGGALTFTANATVSPSTGYPALVCEQAATISGASHTVTANGVVFLGGGYTWSGTSSTNSKFIINGALVMPSGTTLGTTNNGSFSVTYTPAKVNVPDLTTFSQPGLSVQVNSWSQ